MRRIRRWLGRETANKVHHVVIYSRPGCHLCEDALVLLESIARERPLLIDEIDITVDQDLVRHYDILIPVIVVDGRTELTAPIDERELRRAVGA